MSEALRRIHGGEPPLDPPDECACGSGEIADQVIPGVPRRQVCRICRELFDEEQADSALDDWESEATCFAGHRVELTDGRGRCFCGETITRKRGG